MRRFPWVTLATLAVATVVFWSCSNSTNPYGSSNQSTPNPSPNTVIMMNTAFNPGTVTVSKGTTITWKNNDGFDHTSTSDTGVWDTGVIPGGGSKTTSYANAGTFKYHCTIHAGMIGTIVVQ